MKHAYVCTARHHALAGCLLLLTITLSGCGKTPLTITVTPLTSPAPSSSLVPQVTPLSSGKTVLSWQQPLSGGGYTFAMSLREGERWSSPRTISSGPNLSMYPVDLPGVAELPDGALLAYWEVKDAGGADPYATVIQTAVSHDEGRTWGAAARPYNDSWAGQHSFLSWFPAREGIGLIWLDAQQQAMVRHAAMKEERDLGSIGLRYALLDEQGKLNHDDFIAPITCECCPTSATVTAKGPIVVFRSRQDPPGTKPSEVHTERLTIRDIYISRLESGRWNAPRPVHADNWVINGCPDNGPAVDAVGNTVAVAWWTAAGNSPKAQVAFSADGGDTFGPSVRVDAGRAEGQVTVTLLPGAQSAVVGWLEQEQAWARIVSARGDAGPPVALGTSIRHARLPKWLGSSRQVWAVWTTRLDGHSHVAMSQLRF